MKKLSKSILAFLMISTLLFSCILSGCSQNNDNSQINNNQLSIYLLKDDEISPLVKNFNKFQEDIEIKISEFENTEVLFTKLQTEMMAGKGPDLIYYNYNTNNQNMIKYIDNDMFTDLNELMKNDISEDKLIMGEYNQTVVKSGVYDNKQYFMPLTYLVNSFVTTQENCLNYKIDMSDGFSFDTLDQRLSVFLNDDKNKSICTSLPYTLFFEKFIEEEVDNKGEKFNFETPEFENTFSSIEKSYITCDVNENYDAFQEMADGNLLFLGSGYFSGNPYVSVMEADEFFKYNMTPKILSYSRDSNSFDSYVGSFLAINSNSNKKQSAYEFIKFSLDYKQQLVLETNDIPVNNTAFKKYVEKAEKYIESNDEHQDVMASFLKSYLDNIEKVNKCRLNNYYYYENILAPTLSDYLNKTMDYDDFISSLTNKTRLYFDE
ncbi:MAG TPA: extracellular solute-binding protein [Ruminococcus bromii]|nr:extracellular solute-binding protein [Ruminococcus bromii]HJI65286.1 extracellular solute-binding protein [Ruminococcus bromii]